MEKAFTKCHCCITNWSILVNKWHSSVALWRNLVCITPKTLNQESRIKQTLYVSCLTEYTWQPREVGQKITQHNKFMYNMCTYKWIISLFFDLVATFPFSYSWISVRYKCFMCANLVVQRTKWFCVIFLIFVSRPLLLYLGRFVFH